MILRATFCAVAFVATLGMGTPSRAQSAGPVAELKLGALYHDAPGLWSGFQAESPTVDVNGEIIFRPSFGNEFSHLAPAIGATINPLGQTSHAYVDILWQVNPSPLWFMTLGIGAAFNTGEIGPGDANRKWLGSHILFHPSAEIGLNLDAHQSVSVYFEHMSNANLATYNEGMDDIGLRYGYHF